MRAKYKGLQDQDILNKPPMIFVNVKRDFGMNTEVYDPKKHELTFRDTKKIFLDREAHQEAKELRDRQVMYEAFYGHLVNQID